MFDAISSGSGQFFEDEDAAARSGPRPVAAEFDFRRIAPAGYYIAARVSFAFPTHARNELPAAWVEEYTREGLMLRDPALKWIYANRGRARLGELDIEDPAGVIARGAARNLRFGAVVSYCAPGEKAYLSCGQFYRSDREFTDAELNFLFARVRRLHRLTGPASAQWSSDLKGIMKPSSRMPMSVFPKLAG